MYISAKEGIGPHRLVLVVDRGTGTTIPTAFCADTEEGWYAMYVVDPETGRVKVDRLPTEGNGYRAEFVTEKVTRPFDLVNRLTGEVIAESK